MAPVEGLVWGRSREGLPLVTRGTSVELWDQSPEASEYVNFMVGAFGLSFLNAALYVSDISQEWGWEKRVGNLRIEEKNYNSGWENLTVNCLKKQRIARPPESFMWGEWLAAERKTQQYGGVFFSKRVELRWSLVMSQSRQHSLVVTEVFWYLFQLPPTEVEVKASNPNDLTLFGELSLVGNSLPFSFLTFSWLSSYMRYLEWLNW